MDRFLTRNSVSWRAVDATFIRSFANKSFTDNKSTPKPDIKSRRISMRDETLLKIFSSQPDQPLNDENVNPIELFRSISQPAKTESVGLLEIDSSKHTMAHVAVDSCHAVTDRTAHEPADVQNLEVISMTPPRDIAPSSAENVSTRDQAIRNRLQRDLNSPSVNARIRAMKALKSPTKTAYANFDVPHEQEDIITYEERNLPKSIQEVMRNVIVYVEVRTGEDNRSAGVKKVISQLGAKVNDKFLRDTTHVVFKDGLQSTYNKAKKWDIPIVSILWIEACKKHMVLVNPKQYPISNLERYENPELYTKIKRQKSMQPNAEENARRHKLKAPGLGNASKETSEQVKQTVNRTTKISIPRKPKDKLDEILSEFKEKLLSTPEYSEDIMKPDSKLLERIQNSPFTNSITKLKKNNKADSLRKYAVLDSYIAEENSDDDFEVCKPITKISDLTARKALAFDKSNNSIKTKRQSKITSPKKRRATICPAMTQMTQSETPRTTASELSPPSSAKKASKRVKTPASQNRVQSSQTKRQSALFKATDVQGVSKISENATTINKTALLEESCDIDNTQINADKTMVATDSAGKELKKRKTTFTEVPLDISNDTTNNNVVTPKPSTNRRRTLFTPEVMEQTLINAQTPDTQINLTRSVSRRRTCFNFATPILNDSPAEKIKEAEPKEPILVTDNCPPSIRKSVRRRTMFTPSSYEETNIIAQEAVTLNASSAHKPVNPFDCETPAPKPGTILDELNTSLTFSSTKTPINPRRRTMFDISMDIIEQRVQNINKSAHQSRLTEFGSTKLDVNPPKDACQPKVAIGISVKASVNHNQTTSDRTTKGSDRTTVDTFTTDLNKDSFKTSTKIGLDDTNSTAAAAATPPPKKRKLFAPTELLFYTPPGNEAPVHKDKAKDLETEQKKKAKTDGKSVKTIKRINGNTKKSALNVVKSSQSRRSTLDFEQIEKFKTLKSLQNAKPSNEPKVNTMVCTNMHTEQINFIKQAIQKLGGFKFENIVSDNTTHVVSLEPRRTFNLLRGIVRGLWILNYSWIQDSVKNGKWLFEEPYEMIHFSRCVEMCRSQRQAFGYKFKIDLFADVGPIYVSPSSTVPADNLKELITLCSGKVEEDITSAKFILGESIQNDPDKINLSPLWILDSIQDCQIKKITKYLVTKSQQAITV